MFAMIVYPIPKDKVSAEQAEAIEKDLAPVRKWLLENLK